MIYLKLRGRIGNQLFMYAFARSIQLEKGENEIIIIDDSINQSMGYLNSLKEYELENVEFIEEMTKKQKIALFFPWIISRIEDKLISRMDYDSSYKFEKKWQKIYNKIGLIKIRDGYIDYSHVFHKNTYIDGYFQSEKYFWECRAEIKRIFSLQKEIEKSSYPNITKILSRNTVCISVKVEDNAQNPMYDICSEEYYRKAISYIEEHVENPLFFICSDNVQYVKDNLIDTSKYDIVEQSSIYPVHISLAVMGACKHFIITNSTFAWWAQYLSDYNEKIVIAPSRWYGMKADWQWDIYQDNWVTIEV